MGQPRRASRTQPSTVSGALLRRPARLDPAVAWALGLYLVTFPLMLVWLVLVSEAASAAGFDLARDPGGTAARVANTVYVVLVLSTLVAACVVGLYGWLHRRRGAALTIAVLSVLTGVAFVALPTVAG